jgi:hypothetical protein
MLVKLSAPIEFRATSKKSKYSKAGLAKIKMILETNPEMLALFGIDPE